MDPTHINYVNHTSILVLNYTGKIRQLFVPFKVQCIVPIADLKENSWVYVDEVMPHKDYLIIYRIMSIWYSYDCFKITVW
jgi:hypothetical protein